ncbi:MAG: pyridoxal phosphate-dependent aminotransferase [Lentimicrobiaceae bacterium]|nr:pyridoxal phosphate-dependent aminotransferase [Lentimicrobiaceae bacterium]
MSNILSNRINSLAESETLAMSQRSRELQAQGIDVINLSIGEPDFDTPEYIKGAAKEAIDNNFTHYTPVPGYMDLRQAVVTKLKRDNNLDYKASNIVVSTGAKQSLANAILCLINPGDEVIIPAPYWVSYKELVKLAEGVVVNISADINSDYKITPQQLEAAITDKTKMFIFSSPCNPSGSVYSHAELEALCKVFEKHENIFIISDEIYEYINYVGKHESLASFNTIKDRVILINGVSKGYAMTGWRIGYMAATNEIAAACTKLQGQITSGTSSISQKAAISALSIGDAPGSDVAKMRDAFRKRRDMFVKLLNEIEGIKTPMPDGAFYVFSDISGILGKKYNGKTISNDTEFCDFLLDVAHIASVPGAAFGAPNCFRMSYATTEENLIEAVNRLKKALDMLQ